MDRRICGAVIELRPAYESAVRIIPGDLPTAEPGETDKSLRCALEAAHQGAHYSHARGLPLSYPAEVWACWTDGQQPSGVITLPDCAVIDPRQPDEACLLFNHHPGDHSWALADPAEDALRARLGLLTSLRSGRTDYYVLPPSELHCGGLGEPLGYHLQYGRAHIGLPAPARNEEP